MIGKTVEFLTSDGVIRKGIVATRYFLAKQEFFLIKEIDSFGNITEFEVRILSSSIISVESDENKAYEYAMSIV